MIIGIIGNKGVGKDTVANYIEQNINRMFAKIAFADKLKFICSLLTQTPLEDWYNQKLKDTPIKNEYFKKYTYREFMQKLGTDAIRTVFPNMWVDCLFASIDNSKYNYIISDIRFKNEYDAIAKYEDSIFIHVIRNTNFKDYHTSEDLSWIHKLPTYNNFIIINNNFLLQDLYNQINLLIKPLLPMWNQHEIHISKNLYS